MSTIIKFDLKELRKLASDENSCVIEKKVTQNLALQPWCLGNLKESIKNLLDYKIGKFHKELNGILLSYKNLRSLQNVGTIRNDNPDIHFLVQADYFIFCPYVGAMLSGVVNKKSNTHLAILVHRVFNVVIPRPTEQPGNKWIGANVQEGQEVFFKIVVLDLYGALPYIRGELDQRSLLLDPECDEEVTESKQTSSFNVSYIDFDKTKPYTQKQSVHGAQNMTSKGKSKPQHNISFDGLDDSTDAVNGKTNPRNEENENSSTSQVKIKKKRKILDEGAKLTEETPKQSKKRKKDI